MPTDPAEESTMPKDIDNPPDKTVEDSDTAEKDGGRRKTLKKIGIGGAILAALTPWTKPVVTSVVLPAHATASPGGTSD
jgi:hypothetical protein